MAARMGTACPAVAMPASAQSVSPARLQPWPTASKVHASPARGEVRAAARAAIASSTTVSSWASSTSRLPADPLTPALAPNNRWAAANASSQAAPRPAVTYSSQFERRAGVLSTAIGDQSAERVMRRSIGSADSSSNIWPSPLRASRGPRHAPPLFQGQRFCPALRRHGGLGQQRVHLGGLQPQAATQRIPQLLALLAEAGLDHAKKTVHIGHVDGGPGPHVQAHNLRVDLRPGVKG